jgi:Tol biopolymer transport system component/polyisoprenoid-binding protein YceI
VAGLFQLDLDGPPTGQVVTMTVDLRALRSDARPRDQAVQHWLATDKFSQAEFRSTALHNLPAVVREGQEVAFQVEGDLTIRGVTRPATFDLNAVLRGNLVTGSASTTVSAQAFAIPIESNFGLTVDDQIVLRLDFVAVDEGGTQVAGVSSPVLAQVATPAAVSAAQSSGAPALLHDQNRIAFISQRDGNDELYVMNADGSAQIRLTEGPAYEGEPVWSPDGRRIAFAAGEGRFEGSTDIYIVNADGSELRRLTSDPGGAWSPAWSPDGTRLAFVAQRDGRVDIYIMNADGAMPVNLTESAQEERRPIWSPEGRRIAYLSGRERVDLFLMDLDGAEPVNLTRRPGYYELPVWSPDGNRLAYFAGDFNTDIYVIGAEGGEVSRLTNHQAFDGNPVWSPDGSRLAFRTYRDGNFEIYVVNADGSDAVNLTHHPANDESPTWSPDGRQIVFASDRSGTFQLYALDAAAALVGNGNVAPVQLTQDPAGAGGPVWQP